jgi:hypothetical protein
MGDFTDYYNLLEDTLLSSYKQVEKILNRIPEAKFKNKFINIRTAYPMNYYQFTSGYYYNESDEYPICYNFPRGGCATRHVINRLLKRYESWLIELDTNGDLERIEKLVKKEREEALKNANEEKKSNLNKKYNNFHIDMIKKQILGKGSIYFDKDEQLSESESESYRDEGSFIVDDNDIEFEEEFNKEDESEVLNSMDISLFESDCEFKEKNKCENDLDVDIDFPTEKLLNHKRARNKRIINDDDGEWEKNFEEEKVECIEDINKILLFEPPVVDISCTFMSIKRRPKKLSEDNFFLGERKSSRCLRKIKDIDL